MRQSSVHEILSSAKRLISNPKHWCKGEMALARDKFGVPRGCYFGYEHAYAWCAEGAIRWAAQGVEDHEFLLAAALKVINECADRFFQRDFGLKATIVKVNDASNVSHDVIMRLFRNAIDCEKRDIMGVLYAD